MRLRFIKQFLIGALGLSTRFEPEVLRPRSAKRTNGCIADSSGLHTVRHDPDSRFVYAEHPDQTTRVTADMTERHPRQHIHDAAAWTRMFDGFPAIPSPGGGR